MTNAQVRKLKALAQHLETHLHLGKNGLSESFLLSVDQALDQHELVKLKFKHFKDQKEDLAAALAENTSAHLVTIIGHVAVLYRQNPDAKKRRIEIGAPDL